ncbi:ribokinase [Luteimonas sp. SX5]|uniref:Ribokinase n=1 Tax=Luteimonas galliterrae TaxID=2940486 RepID=A0ABT0MKE9_9GAMM|nr:ribokinase [Luteimonas galliterrae]
MGKVVVVGSFNVDHVWTTAALPRAGETLSGEYATGPGGKGFNQAVAARRAGADTAFVCALGDDMGGQLARALAAADGIDLRGQRSERSTGTAGVYVDGEGRNSIVIGAGANADLSPAFIASRRDLIAAADVLLAQLESPAEAVLAALRAARASGVITLLNPAPANAVVTAELLSATDILTPNETEFSALLARHVGERIEGDAVAALDQARLHALCRELSPAGTVVVTLGASGCFVSHAEDVRRGDDNAYYRIAAEPVRAIDTTGAGDAFNGALAAAIASAPDAPFAEPIRRAGRYAALSTERQGAAASMPQAADVQARFGP